jgi:membrane dipeptidase
MRAALSDSARRGVTREDATMLMADMAAREIVTSADARKAYLDLWARSGVTVTCGSYTGSPLKMTNAFEAASRVIAQAHAYTQALRGELVPIREASDIERVHREGRHGVIMALQNVTPFGEDLDRIDHFWRLGVRMVQLTLNLRNLVGDGCMERNAGGLSHFGCEVVRRLNSARILVDVSHCSERVGWDALEVSDAPIVVSHSSSKAVCYHDRGKTDDLARAIAERGGFFGVVLIPGFLSESRDVTLDDFCRHVEHLVSVCGIDHVGIGSDKTGPGPSTGSMVDYPDTMPQWRAGSFNWTGVRDEHRVTAGYHLHGYEGFGDWPNLTVALARWGFDEEELRKLLGLNFLRVFRDVVG